jgi:hypothetical protein
MMSDPLPEIKARFVAYKIWVEGGPYEGDPGREFQNHAPADIDTLIGEVERLREERDAIFRTSNATFAAKDARIERLRGLLGRLEWADNYSERTSCPACMRYRDQGHDPGCWLAAELARNADDPPEGSQP